MRKGNQILVGLGAALTACGGTAAVEEPMPVSLRPAVVRVENQSYVDFNIFVLRAETRQRLGRATANTTQSFRIPASVMSGQPRIKLAADPIGTQIIGITREISVLPGDTVFLVIPPG